MNYLCIDPGPQVSGVVLYCHGKVLEAYPALPNRDVLSLLEPRVADELVVEMIASYGMSVGKDVFETCVWIGRFIQQWRGEHTLIYRKDVKMALCGTPRAKDTNIRTALIDMFGPGKQAAIGTKKEPGPLYSVKKHAWAALAVGVTHEMAGAEG